MVEILSILVKIIVVEIQESLMMRHHLFSEIFYYFIIPYSSRFYSILLLTQMQYVTFKRLLENLNVNIRRFDPALIIIIIFNPSPLLCYKYITNIRVSNLYRYL